MKYFEDATILVLQIFCTIVWINIVQAQDTSDDKSFQNYNLDILKKYEYKDYLAAIFENEGARQGFVKSINEHLTEQIKEDMKAVRVFKKVGNVEMPAIAFSAGMDTWLGVLPQWRRIKKFLFQEMEGYVSAHPEILNNVRTYRTNSNN